MNSAEKQTVLHCLKSMIDEASCEECPLYGMTGTDHCEKDCVRLAINALEQQPCEMTAEEYRQRMIDAFHNADCGELIALVVLPTEKEFEHLEWLLEKHYKTKPEPCTDTISRQNATAQCFQAMELISGEFECELSPEKKSYNAGLRKAIEIIRALPPVNPAEKVGQIDTEVLDKIRAEIEKQEKWLSQAGYTAYNADIAFSSIKSVLAENEASDADSD